MKIDDVHTLPYEVRFSFTKKSELQFNALQGYSYLLSVLLLFVIIIIIIIVIILLLLSYIN